MNYVNIKKICRLLIPKKLWDFLSITKKKIKFYKELKRTRKYTTANSKEQKKDTIIVVFIVYMPEVFLSLESIYENLKKDDRFSVLLLAQPHVDNQQGLQNQNPAYSYLKEKYQDDKRIINAFDNGIWFDLKSQSPDYVFYTRPYCHQYYKEYNPEVVRKYAKVCYHPYGYDIDNTADFYIMYNLRFLATVSIIFNTAESTCLKVKKILNPLFIKRKYPKVITTGFARFDILVNSFIESQNKRTILWLPRWTAENLANGEKKGHFIKYFDNFLEYAGKNKSINFIIRPHPLMFPNYLELGILTQDQIKNVYERCNNLGNVFIDTQKNYLKSLTSADILLSDYTGLLAEFFVSGRPIVYCDDASTFNKEGKKMDKLLYHTNSWNEIEHKLTDLLNGKDELSNKRKELIPEIMYGNNISKKIIELIYTDYLQEL